MTSTMKWIVGGGLLLGAVILGGTAWASIGEQAKVAQNQALCRQIKDGYASAKEVCAGLAAAEASECYRTAEEAYRRAYLANCIRARVAGKNDPFQWFAQKQGIRL